MVKTFTTTCLLIFAISTGAQVDRTSDLFQSLRIVDSLFFERGFNQCDLNYLEKTISMELKFFHDQSGFQDRSDFFENTKKYICSNQNQKPIRKLEKGSLVVYPLHDRGTLYGAIQKGKHHFYLREEGKEDEWTSTALFTHVWILEGDQWKLSEVLSYNHDSN